MTRRIISTSDWHIFNDSRYDKICQLCDLIDRERPDLLVLNGDIGDPWKTPWVEIIKTNSWMRLQKTCLVRSRLALETIYINRNHDYNAKPAYLPWAKLCGEYREGGYLFMHGWEFDVSWGGIFGLPGIAPVAFWLSRKTPWLMIPIYNLLFRRRGKTPNQRKQRSAGVTTLPTVENIALRDEWTWQIGTIHLQAMKRAKKEGLDITIGHTHCPKPYDGLMVDDGDMTDSFTYVDIQDTVSLKQL